MPWHEWVVLIAGSTGSGLRAVSPSRPSHHAGCPGAISLSRKRDGFLVALALAIMAQTIQAILLASAITATLVGFRASKADVCERRFNWRRMTTWPRLSTPCTLKTDLAMSNDYRYRLPDSLL